jgi:nucleoside diphosphate kinase homolog 5
LPCSCLAFAYADGTCNAVHGSDSQASARREIKFFFPQRTPATVPAAPGGKVKIPASLETALCKGLSILARDKPTQHPMAALAWLGDWLLNSYPLRPKILAAEDLTLINVDDESEFRSTGASVPEQITQSTTDKPSVMVGTLLLDLVAQTRASD